MGEVNWGLGLQTGNPGEAFAQSFERGMERRKQLAEGEAMRGLALNPDDPKALADYSKYNPKGAMDFMHQKRADAIAAIEPHRKSIEIGAAIVRQIKPTDDATWQQALATAHRAGADISGAPQHFDQQYVSNLVTIADAAKPAKEETQPNIAREVEYYRSIGRPELADQLLTNHANPQIGFGNPDGTYTIARPPLANLGPPAHPSVTFTPIDGGQTPPASGNFPR